MRLAGGPRPSTVLLLVLTCKTLPNFFSSTRQLVPLHGGYTPSFPSTPPAMTDATAKLSELLSAARGRRMLDDAMGVVRREPSTKTLLSNSFRTASDVSSNSFIEASSASDPTDLDASMRLVRSYAARVKQLPPSPEAAFGNFPPSQPPQGNSFIERAHVSSFRDRFNSPKAGCSFRRERLLRRQSLSSPRPQVSREGSPEASSSILCAKYFSPEPAPFLKPATILKAAPALAETRLVAEDGLPARPQSFTTRPSPQLSSPPLLPRRLSTGMPGYPPAAVTQRRLPALLPAVLPASEDAIKTVKTRNVAPPASRHVARAVPRARRNSTSDINARRALWLIPDALPAPSSSKRLLVRGGARGLRHAKPSS